MPEMAARPSFLLLNAVHILIVQSFAKGSYVWSYDWRTCLHLAEVYFFVSQPEDVKMNELPVSFAKLEMVCFALVLCSPMVKQ
jgi:hypothetical protein